MMKHLDPSFARSLLAGPRHVAIRANVVGDVAIETLLYRWTVAPANRN